MAFATSKVQAGHLHLARLLDDANFLITPDEATLLTDAIMGVLDYYVPVPQSEASGPLGKLAVALASVYGLRAIAHASGARVSMVAMEKQAMAAQEAARAAANGGQPAAGTMQ